MKLISSKLQQIFKAPDEKIGCAYSDECEKANDEIYKKEAKVPFIITLIYKSLSYTVRNNIVKWKSLVNFGKTTVPEDLFIEINCMNENNYDSGSSDTQSKWRKSIRGIICIN